MFFFFIFNFNQCRVCNYERKDNSFFVGHSYNAQQKKRRDCIILKKRIIVNSLRIDILALFEYQIG